MSALHAAKKKFSSGLPANPANPANLASDIRKIRKIRKGREADENSEVPPSAARARRRNALRAMMAEDDQPRSHYWKTFDDAHPDYVILAFAIRGKGSGELSIPKEKYDAFKLLEILEGAGI